MNWMNLSTLDECPCCLNQFNIIENIVHLPCLHATCVKCHLLCKTCPMCRGPFDTNMKPPIYNIINSVGVIIKNSINNNVNVDNEILYLDELKKYI